MHIPVLLKEAIEGLGIRQNDTIVDCTLGGGGHSEEIVRRYGSSVRLVGIDQDRDAILRTEERIRNANAQFIESNFRNVDDVLKSLGIAQIDRALFDFGLSSFQLDDSDRGFTFMRDEPLSMTMKKDPAREDLTAHDIVNTWSEETLADVIYAYGEEKYSRKIARAIVNERKKASIETTGRLSEIIKSAVPASYRHGKIHPATRTFQAIRIATNNELESIKEALPKTISFLSSGGRIAAISFHSLEDRIVKDIFKKNEEDGIGKRITKKPITPGALEIKENPRSRSAKLRIFEKN